MPRIDLIGHKYGKLTVVKFQERKKVKSKRYVYLWECDCSCGNKTVVISGNLKNGTTKSCGCNQHPKLELIGKKFNRWTVIDKIGTKILENCRQGKTYWLCKCDCGKIKEVYGNSLVSGKSISCGCFKRKHPKGLSARRMVFVEYRTKCKRKKWEFDLTEEEFNELIIKDCFYCGSGPSNISNKNSIYGSFEYNGIDRINNDKGYTKQNIVTSCKNCNLAKRKLSTKEFFNMIKMIYERHLNEE